MSAGPGTQQAHAVAAAALADDDEGLGAFTPGTSFGRYSIVRRLAVGGMAAVYEATHVDLHKRVAIKVMLPKLAKYPSLFERFVLEARTASRLSHPHVIAVTDVGVEKGLPYLVMDFLEGEDLFTKLQRDGAMPVDRTADILLPVVSAVAAAHADGILHRDVKPENIFVVCGRHHREHPVLLDFGISKPVGDEVPVGGSGRSLTGAGEAVGTPHYMSPEQLQALELDGRCDEYALGVILYECVTGVHPFPIDQPPTGLLMAILAGDAPPPSSHDPTVPPAFDALVARAMAASRDERFADVHALGRALLPFASARSQALWAEEFGEPPSLARPSAPASRSHALTSVRQPGHQTTVPANVLSSVQFLDGCDEADLNDLLEHASTRRLPAGTTIVTEGAQGNGCFLLASGEVEIVKATSRGHWVLGRLPPGSVFGQIALVDHLPRTASIVAATEVTVVHIGRQTFDAMLAKTSDVALRLREQIGISAIRQLRRATRRLAQLLDTRQLGPSSDQRRELLYVQAAAQEWGLSIEGPEAAKS